MSCPMAKASASAAPSILLVDDEADILPEYKDFLELEGFNAHTCVNPEQALDEVLGRPDVGLVITDLRMAKLDGISLIRQLRALIPAERKLEFIILTGDATYQTSADLAHIPVLIKPTDANALILEIKAALKRTE